MTKAMAIRLIRYYVEEFLPPYINMCPPYLFEERSYKRTAAIELADYIRDSDDNPYVATAMFRQKAALRKRRSRNRSRQLYHAYECQRQIACDILEILEAMEGEYENEAFGFEYS